MKLKRDEVLEFINEQISLNPNKVNFTTQELSEALDMQRSNISAILNDLANDNILEKTDTRPVYFSLSKNKEGSCFREMIGSDGSLKQVVQLTKAALLYPGYSLPILITGYDGSGKSLLAELTYKFAMEERIISKNGEFIKINCKYLVEESDEKIEKIFFSKQDGAMDKAKGGILFIDHINRLNQDVQYKLMTYIEKAQASSMNMILLYSVDDSISPALLSLYRSKFSIIVDLPDLSSRSFEERFELIKLFFNGEARCIDKEIKINSEVLRCLLLYPTKSNVKQLRRDIQLACANGYARNFQEKSNTLELNIHDFPTYIRKGFLSYRKYRSEIEEIIPDNYLYIFSGKKMDASQYEKSILSNDNFYNMIDRKIEELKSYGVEEDDIMTIIHGELEYNFQKINSELEEKGIDKDAISKIVDPRIIRYVKDFLKSASIKFNKVFSNSVFYGLCLHLQAMIERNGRVHKLSDDQIVSMIKEYNEEYMFSSEFASKLEKELDIKIPVDEIVFISMFLLKEDFDREHEGKPVILVAMHGNSTARSIVEVSEKLMGEGNIFYFDLPLDKDMEEAYEKLNQTIVNIHQGKGVLMLYDMGSFKLMADMISKDTGIEIKTFCIPATLIALDCSRKASIYNSVDEVYKEVVSSYQSLYPEIENAYQIQEKPQVIISLCMTGDGAAVQIKNYIEQHVYLENTEIIPIAISDRNYLLKRINQIQKKQKIICVIGSYDPKLYGIPYIPISKLFNTDPDKLEFLLSLNTFEPIMSINYDAIYEYLEEELEGFDIELVKEILPRAILKIRKVANGLSSDQEFGLFIHIVCTIYHLQNGEESEKNKAKEKIIFKNKKLYNDLKDILSVIEDEFYIKFSDDEISYIIQIIKKC